MAGALPPPPPRPEKKEGEDDKDGDEEKDAVPKVVDKKGKFPKAVAEQLIERKGYANYHFNLVQQDRFIAALRDQFPGGEAGNEFAWVIEAETDEDNPQPALLRVTSGKMAMLVGDRPIEAETKAELYDGVSAKSIAGMLPALDAWRRMIAQGPKKFGETYSLGTVPLGGERPLRDCIVGIDGELEVRWLYHPESHLVEVIEVFADRDEDPAEFWMIRERGADMPTILELRYGLESVLAPADQVVEASARSRTQAATEEKT